MKANDTSAPQIGLGSNNERLFVIVALGFWGKGKTLDEAAHACHKAGASKHLPVVGYCYVGLPDELAKTTVDDGGDISYSQKVESIRLFGPSDCKASVGTFIKGAAKKKR